jgi:hypothetical protein
MNVRSKLFNYATVQQPLMVKFARIQTYGRKHFWKNIYINNFWRIAR